MDRIVTWIKTHKGLTALFVFIILWVVVTQQAPFGKRVVRTSSSSGAVSFTAGLMGMPGSGANYASDDMMEESVIMKAVGAPDIAPSPMPPFEPSAGESAAEVEQRIIKTGTITAVFPDIDDAIADLTTHASDVGGFIEHSSASENRQGVRSGRVTMRVPVMEFESSLQHVRDLSDFVRHESVDGQDVTEQYTDIQARLNNARAQEEAYLAILDRATSVEDILKVQRELGNIRAQIESYEGRLKYLENRTSYSTISVQLEEEAIVQVPTEKFRPWTAVKQAVAALVNALQNIVISLIWTVILGLGLAIPAALVIWIVWRIVKRFWLKG